MAQRAGVKILLENQCGHVNGHFVRGVCADAAVKVSASTVIPYTLLSKTPSGSAPIPVTPCILFVDKLTCIAPLSLLRFPADQLPALRGTGRLRIRKKHQIRPLLPQKLPLGRPCRAVGVVAPGKLYVKLISPVGCGNLLWTECTGRMRRKRV